MTKRTTPKAFYGKLSTDLLKLRLTELKANALGVVGVYTALEVIAAIEFILRGRGEEVK